jgi:hypothetical protein
MGATMYSTLTPTAPVKANVIASHDGRRASPYAHHQRGSPDLFQMKPVVRRKQAQVGHRRAAVDRQEQRRQVVPGTPGPVHILVEGHTQHSHLDMLQSKE